MLINSFTEYTSDESIYERGIGIPVIKRKPKFISDTEKQRLTNLYERIKITWPENEHRSTTAMVQRTAEISGISEYALYPILREILEPNSVKKDTLKESSNEVTKLNYAQKCAIIDLVNNFYIQGEMPTIYRIYFAIRDKGSIPNVSMRTLRSVLRRLRFKYLMDNNTVLLQSEGAALRRIKYVQEVLRLRNENLSIYFVDQMSVKTGKRQCCLCVI